MSAGHGPSEHGGNKGVALLISVLALVLAFSETLGKGAQTAALAYNIEASNLWAFFQAKTIRQTVLRTAAEQMEVSNPGEAVKKQIAKWKETADRYQSEPETGEGRKELSARAKEAEKKRDTAMAAYHHYELASAAAEIGRYRTNLQDELDGAALYAALAAAEADPVRKDLFLQLSQAEAEHAKVWKEKLAAAGIQDVRYAPSLRTRLLARLAGRFGPRFVLPAIAAAEFADRNKYSGQADAAALSSEEQGHAAVVQAVAAGARPSAAIGTDIARAERWHRGGAGNELRAAVLGANDGLVSTFCLIMGVAGAGVEPRFVLLTGLAGLIAGASSMALGEWLSVTNARELARTQIAKEREEIEQAPEAEQKE